MIFNYTLPNGIRLVVNKMDGMYSVSIGILVGAGSVNESLSENGISHFIEHVNFKGTEKRTAFQLSQDADMLGAQINAFTSKEFTCYYVKSIAEHTSKSFEILSDLFVNSVYSPEELDRERGVIIEEINMYEDTPDELCMDLLASSYFGDLGYGAQILGPKSNVQGFTRQDVINYKKKYYTTDNIVVSVAGGVDEKEVFDLCNKYLGCLKASKMAQKPAYNTVNLQKSVCKCKDIEQVHMAFAYPSVNFNHPDGDKHAILTSVLGGGMSSRLFQTVREKLGLCYSVYAYPTAYVDCGFTVVYAGVGKDALVPAYDAIIKEMNLLKDKGITEEEFLRSREQMKASLVFSQENVVSQMILYGKRKLLIGDDYDISKRLKDLNALSKDSVNGVIGGLFDERSLAKAVVGKNVSPL